MKIFQKIKSGIVTLCKYLISASVEFEAVETEQKKLEKTYTGFSEVIEPEVEIVEEIVKPEVYKNKSEMLKSMHVDQSVVCTAFMTHGDLKFITYNSNDIFTIDRFSPDRTTLYLKEIPNRAFPSVCFQPVMVAFKLLQENDKLLLKLKNEEGLIATIENIRNVMELEPGSPELLKKLGLRTQEEFDVETKKKRKADEEIDRQIDAEFDELKGLKLEDK